MREDVELADEAKRLGWIVIKIDGANYPLSFQKRNKTLWLCREGWRSADLIKNRYKNHKWEKSLKRALNSY